MNNLKKFLIKQALFQEKNEKWLLLFLCDDYRNLELFYLENGLPEDKSFLIAEMKLVIREIKDEWLD